MNQSTMVVPRAGAGPGPARGGSVAWACHVGFPPAAIFPFTPPERAGIRNLFEFQTLMYRPLYWLGRNGRAEVDPDLSLAEPPEWDDDGRTVTVTVKPWRWSNGETVCADNVMFWVNMMVVKGERLGSYVPGLFPDNLVSYRKVAPDRVRFEFDRAYSRTWVLMNQLSLITPMPRAWDRFGPDAPANASGDPADIPAVYDYLVAENGEWTRESNDLRTRWPDSPVWSVVNGPWRLRSFAPDGTVTFVPNQHYSGPNPAVLDEFRQVPVHSDEDLVRRLRTGPAGDGIQVGYLPYGSTGDPADPADSPMPADYRLVPQDVTWVSYMPLNFGNGGFAGRAFRQAYLRQALQSCLDQDRAIREIFHGHAHRTDGPLPVVGGGREEWRPGTRWPFDIRRAREILADHGWDVSRTPAVCVRPGAGPGRAGEGIEAGDRLSFGLRYIAGKPALTALVNRFAVDAARAGIELRLEAVNGSVMVAQDHTDGGPGRTTWEINTWNGGWVFYGHPTGEVLFRSGAGSNWGRFSDPVTDELIDRTLLSDDRAHLRAYYDHLADQVPAIWAPTFPLRLMLVAPNLGGVEPINPYGLINPENWYYMQTSAGGAR